jgi:TfoX/Sxy family transcriptional regulator of competence genes
MAFDEELAERVRPLVTGLPGMVEKRMFGGVAFLVHGNMSVGIHRDDLIVRLDPSESDAALEERGTRVFDLTGRPMKGWLVVDGSTLRGGGSLASWVTRGVAYAQSLPPK